MENPTSKKVLLSYYTVVLALCFMDILVYLSIRPIWFFINKTAKDMLGGDIGWSWVILGLFFVIFIYILINFILALRNKRNYYKKPSLINIILPGILVLIPTLADAALYSMLGSSESMVVRNLAGMLPCLLLVFFTAIIFAVYPSLDISKSIVFKISAVVVLSLVIIVFLNNPGNVKITSGPFIQYIDDSNIAVMWTTNKKSTGSLEYGSDKSSLKKIEEVDNGIDVCAKIHRLVIPASGGFIYRVTSTKINNYYPNNVEFGNTAASEFKTFENHLNSDNVSFYILNDVHENENIYKRFLSKGDYDFLVLNGDTLNSVDSEKLLINELLKPVSLYTNGVKPIYFVRGNHETRGVDQDKLMDYISFPENEYFYSFRFGPLYAIVLDSGEDKLDSHEEYSGLAHFKEYRENETLWLADLSEKERDIYMKSSFRIVFIHIPLNGYMKSTDLSYLKEYEEKWTDLLGNMNIDAAFSGHTHVPEIINPDNENFNFPIFIGGGEYNKQEDYAAVKVSVSKDIMKVQYINYAGDITNEYELKGKPIKP